MIEAPIRGYRPAAPLRERWWAQVLVLALVVAGFAIAFVWSASRDVVANWKVLATCAAPATATIERSTPFVDTSPCSGDQVEVHSARGWPILTFVLPISAGIEPRITSLTSNKDTRTVELHFDLGDATGSTGEEFVLVFVEVPPHSLPRPPFTIRDASGSTTVELIRVP